MLQDPQGRRFYYLRLSITDVCNFRCSYCLPNGYQGDTPRRFLTVAEIANLALAFANLGTRKIRITGGEPSLRKDLPQIIATLAQTPGIDTVTMTTNGDKLLKHLSTWHQAGLSSINVSIDSLDPRVFASITGHDKLQQILAGIELALELGMSVKVNAVLMRGINHTELLQFCKWLQHKPLTLRFIELMETGDHSPIFDAEHISAESLKQQLIAEGWQKLLRDSTAGPAQEFQHPDYAGKIGLIMPYSKGFCDSCNRLRVSALGRLHLCLFAEQGIDLRGYLTAGDITGLQDAISDSLRNKADSHWLDQGKTGATKHLAMLGG